MFLSLPTGSGGKSLCFSVLPYVFDDMFHRNNSIVVVVSPLIALMKDQVRITYCILQLIDSFFNRSCMALTAKGMSAVCIAGLESRSSISLQVQEGKFQVVIINPEILILNLSWRQMLRTPIYQTNLVAIVIDEAHCVTKW